jgi:hypothetical protein
MIHHPHGMAGKLHASISDVFKPEDSTDPILTLCHRHGFPTVILQRPKAPVTMIRSLSFSSPPFVFYSDSTKRTLELILNNYEKTSCF